MKKTYLKPTQTITATETEQLMAASSPLVVDEKAGEGEYGLAKENSAAYDIWGDDEE